MKPMNLILIASALSSFGSLGNAYANGTHALSCAMVSGNVCTTLVAIGPSTTIGTYTHVTSEYVAFASLEDAQDGAGNLLTLALSDPTTHIERAKKTYLVPASTPGNGFTVSGSVSSIFDGTVYTLVCAGSNYAEGSSGSVNLCPTPSN